jgi:sigma-B regulation protein RsbU (phosphoserine phosphatase)
MRSKPATTSNSVWPYALLGLLLAITLVSQIPFTVDIARVWNGDYPNCPLQLGSPWPTIVAEGIAAREAGLRKGDRVLAIAGRPPAGFQDLQVAVRGRHPGDVLPIVVQRDGRPVEFHPRLSPVLMRHGVILATFLLLPWFCIALGFWVVAVRVHDKLAWLTLGILLGLGQLYRPDAIDALGWPGALGVVTVAFRAWTVFLWAVSMMLFGFLFPKPGRLDRAVPWLKFTLPVPLLLFGFWESVRAAGMALDFRFAERVLPPNPLPNWLVLALVYGTTGLFFSALGEKYSDPTFHKDDRRRLKLLYWGCTVAMTPSAALLIFSLAAHGSQPGGSPVKTWADMMMILVPVTLAYVIVVERAMDVRMVIRQGVQYALARRGVRALQFLLTFAIVTAAAGLLDATRMSQPEKFALIAVGILLVLRVRDFGERLRRWVDRRFFRESYNAEKILSELSEQVRGILDRDALLETVARRISESLHVDRIAVLLPRNGTFRPAMALGYPAGAELTWDADDPALDELRAKREPVPVNEESTHADDAELLLPLATHKDLLGFISLGPKRSEEPYSPSDTSLLRTVAAQTGMALENSRLSEAIAAEIAHREMRAREMEIAREVQQRLFPQNQPEVAELSYAGYCRPALGVGGDYYDFLALAGGRFGLAIGDVSGKGVPAALLMASLQASVRGQSMGETGRVADLMSNVNRLVCDATPENRYATFFYAQYDPATRRLVYTNGGHNPPMLIRGGELIRLEEGGPPVGLFRIAPYTQAECRLEPGDLLVCFTDGISEAENPAEEEWGEEALVAAARACARLAPAEMIQSIMLAADQFANGAPQHDDMTLVIAKVPADAR